MNSSLTVPSSLLALFALTLNVSAQVQISTSKDSAVIKVDGKLFTQYNVGDVPRPYFYPVIGPSGIGMTRNYPIKKGIEGEETDHIHHRGVWYGHRHVNGHNFWGESKGHGKIVHNGFHQIKSGKDSTSFKTTNDWISNAGETICTDERLITVYDHPEYRILDFSVTLKASHGDLIFGDDKDAGMATRVPHTMKVVRRDKTPAQGHILMSDGSTDGGAWGKQAAWCYTYGLVEDEQVGVAIFDHPSNPRHKTWWHARTYGLIAANAFGKRHFEKLKDPHAGDLKIPNGETRTFRYRLLWNTGTLNKEQLDAEFRKFAQK